MEEGKWYVVHTYSGYENKVAQDLAVIVENRRLQEMIQEVQVPTEIVSEVKDGVKRESERKLFPSYVFVKMVMNDDSWYVVRNVRGVTGFVGPSSKPIPLTSAEVEKMGLGKPAAGGEIVVDYKVGDNAKIVGGPLEGFIAVVDAIDLEKQVVKVKVSMFGRETEAELELSQVRPI